jgi:TRAP-type mannitol/chloroaromatic compound transport system permease small subunit
MSRYGVRTPVSRRPEKIIIITSPQPVTSRGNPAGLRESAIMRHAIEQLADRIDRTTALIGRAAACCCLFIVLVEFAVVVMRYAFGVGSIRLQESVLYAHAALFMLAAAWTLQIDGHVRVDIFYRQAKPRTRAVIDLAGALIFLMPFAIALAFLSMPYVERSWAIFERSREASGLPLVYLLKTLIPLFAVLIGLQGVAQAIRAALVLAEPQAASLPSPARGGG